MGEEEQRVRSFSSETRAKSKASRQAGKRSQEKSKRVLKFVKVSTTKKQAPQTYMSSSNGEVFSKRDFLKKESRDRQARQISNQ